nr:50S ribosomal protein L18-like isoform X4 [Tanacetum cinerariifolium]
MEEYIRLEEEKARRRDFENEFPSIVYNDALTCKSDFLTEPTVSPQLIDEFNLKDETSLSESDEEEQNVLSFNDLFPFNVIHFDDSKSDKDNDDNKIDVKQSMGNSIKCGGTYNAKATTVVGEVLAMRLKVKGLVSDQERGIHVDVNKELEKKDFEN